MGGEGKTAINLGEGGSYLGKVKFFHQCLLGPYDISFDRDRILERLRESSDRRTPVPDPLNEDDEEAVRIIRTRREEREKEREKDKEERERSRMLRREEEAKERSRR